jgi:opacity protein-like surface antigen
VGSGFPDFSDEQVNVGLDAKAGLSIDITEKISGFTEYRFTYFNPEYDDSFAGQKVEIETDFYTHHILFGISFRF